MLTAVFWKKAWSWTKHHWYFPVIVVLMIVFMVTRTGSTKRLLELMSVRHDQYKKEIDILNKAAEEKKQKTDEVVELHQETLEGIELDHKLKIQDLEVEKREELDALVTDLEDNPDELAREVAKLLNAEHVEAP